MSRHLNMTPRMKWAVATANLFIVTHPLVLWAMTAGESRWMILPFYFLLCLAFKALMSHGDVRSIVSSALCLALVCIIDTRLLFVVAVSLPFLPLLAPPSMVRAAPGGFLLALLFPSAALVGSFLYLHFLFPQVPFAGFQIFEFGQRSALPDLAFYPWTYNPQNKWGFCLLLFGAATLAFPLACIGPFLLGRERLTAAPLCIGVITPVIAGMLAIFTAFHVRFPDYPAALLTFLCVPAAIASYELITRRHVRLVLFFLLLGWLGGASLFYPSAPVMQWVMSSEARP